MSSKVVKSCCLCDVVNGIVHCEECEKSFCSKHYFEHYEEIKKDYEQLINEQKQFQNHLKDSNEEIQKKIFDEIDQWKKELIEQIKRIAKQTKENYREKLSQSNQNRFSQSKEIEENLLQIKESQQFSEFRLKQFQEQFQRLNEEISSFQLVKSTNPISIEIQQINRREEEIDPFSSIFSIQPEKPPQKNFQEIHLKSEGPIRICEVDRFGHYLLVENDGSTGDKDLVGWTIRRQVDSHPELFYRFPNDFIFKSNSKVKILSFQASEILFSAKKENCLIAKSISSWLTPFQSSLTILYDANGQEKDRFQQSF